MRPPGSAELPAPGQYNPVARSHLKSDEMLPSAAFRSAVPVGGRQGKRLAPPPTTTTHTHAPALRSTTRPSDRRVLPPRRQTDDQGATTGRRGLPGRLTAWAWPLQRGPHCLHPLAPPLTAILRLGPRPFRHANALTRVTPPPPPHDLLSPGRCCAQPHHHFLRQADAWGDAPQHGTSCPARPRGLPS